MPKGIRSGVRNPGFLIVPARINLRALPTRRTVSASPPRTPRLLSVTESVALPTHAHRAPALFALHVAHDVGTISTEIRLVRSMIPSFATTDARASAPESLSSATGDAVLIAPVSKQIPWYQGILQGILRFSGLETRFSAKKPPRCSHFSSNTRRQPDKTQSEHMFSAFGSPITSRSGSEKVSMRRYAWVIWPTPISRSAHRPDSGQDGREPCLSGVPRHSQDSRRAHRSCLPDAWNRILEIRIRYQRRRMTLRPFSQVTSASVPSRESREVLHYFQYQHWCRELAVVRGTKISERGNAFCA